jgi:hypothetical protein
MIFTLPDKDKNSVKTIIGDELSSPSEFFPSVKLSRWENEVSFKVGFDVSAIPKGQRAFSNLGNNNYQLTTPLLNFKIYPFPANEQMEDGGLEFEIILKTKPPTNKISMPIETAGLDFFYQPPLTQEEIGQGATRPENVVGSYAVYHSTKRDDYSPKGGKNYRAGKAFHIFRPRATDALGATAWADLNVDIVLKKLTIDVPQAFLDSATYPVIIDPTFGYTTIGGTEFDFATGYIYFYRQTLAEAGTIQSMSMYGYYLFVNGENAQYGVYDNSNPMAKQAVTGTVVWPYPDPAWNSGNLTTQPSLPAGDYWLCCQQSGTHRGRYDTGGIYNWRYIAQVYVGWPDTISGDSDGGQTRLWSLYCTYAAAGGTTYNEAVTLSSTPACSHSPQADLLGSVGFASTPALSPAAIADLMGGVTMLSAPAASMIGGMDYAAELTLLSNPAVGMACLLDMFPSLILASDPALAASALADFYNSLTLASTPAAVMAAVADLIAGVALASDPAFAALGGSDFYESLALSSSPALSNAVFKEAFGELTLASSPALATAALADLLAEIVAASSPAFLAAGGFDINEVITLVSNALFTAASALTSGPVTSIGSKRASAGLPNQARSGLKRGAGAGLRRDA